jgi:hypothetical protein
VFHGALRDGDKYFEAAEALASHAHVDPQTTLIVAPNFFDDIDARKRGDLTGMPLWKTTGWMEGAAAVDGEAVSSFGVIDDLLVRLSDPASTPHLKRIVIAGHSGGGQFVDRYAILNHVHARLVARGIDVSYVIANPSSYLYFSPERPQGDGFAPYDRSVCPDYDRYKYGVQDPVPYAQGVTGPSGFATFATRHVSFLWGSEDIDPNHPALDKSCSAEAQGPTRYVRGHSYWRYEHALDHPSGPLAHQAFDVIGVGHDQARMLGSECGSALLFGVTVHGEGTAACTPVSAPP